MNNNEYNNAQRILQQLINSQAGKNALKNLENASSADIMNKIQSMDKDELAQKLSAMNLSGFADKINSLNKGDLVKVLSSNPQLIKNLLK